MKLYSKQSVDKAIIRCYYRHDFEQYECPKTPQGSKANYVETTKEASYLWYKIQLIHSFSGKV